MSFLAAAALGDPAVIVADGPSNGLDAAARAVLAQLEQIGISLDDLTDQLLAEGVAQFEDAFDELLQGVAQKAEQLRR